MYTLTSKKVALIKVERKRYWLNAVDSVAFDHPSIKAATKTTSNENFSIKTKVPSVNMRVIVNILLC